MSQLDFLPWFMAQKHSITMVRHVVAPTRYDIAPPGGAPSWRISVACHL